MTGTPSNRSAGRPGDDRERVLEASDIVRVIGEHLRLKGQGREFVGLCPFHDDHKPSMRVSPAKQIFKCFSCGAGGDVFSFIQKYHKMDFREALEFLAERAGIELTKFKPAAPSNPDLPAGPTKQDLYGAATFATEFFQAILRHPQHGEAARAVVARRGISPAMIERFRIGAAPDRWDGLILALQAKDLDVRAFADAGLVKRRENSEGHYDALRHRLIFPIQDQIGRVIAFGGRKIRDEDEPKYLNSPETRLFNKSATLFALHQASRAIQAEKRAIVTEGYTDAIACHQAGFEFAVATLGTALTPEHGRVLRRLCDTVVLVFDGDEAGQRAADRAVAVFLAEAIDVKIATLNRYTDAKDPDELLKREGGAEVFRQALDGAIDLLDFRFARLREKLRGAGLSALNRAVLDEIAAFKDMGLDRVEPLRKKLIEKRLAQLAGVPESTIREIVGAGRRAPMSGQAEASVEAKPQDFARTWPNELIGCLLVDGALVDRVPTVDRDLLTPAAMRSGGLATALAGVAIVIDELIRVGEEPDVHAVLAELAETNDTAGQAAASSLAYRVQEETSHEASKLLDYFQATLARAREQRGLAGAPGESAESALARMRQQHQQSPEGVVRPRLPRPPGG